MTIDEFIQGIRVNVCGEASQDIVDTLESSTQFPSTARFLELRTWFQSLDDKAKSNIATLVGMTADHTMFKFMLLLDGEINLVTSRERLFLAYTNNTAELIVNPIQGDPVHHAWLGYPPRHSGPTDMKSITE